MITCGRKSDEPRIERPRRSGCGIEPGDGQSRGLALAREGAKLAICARTASAISAAADEIRTATGADVLAQPTDVTDYDAVRRLVAETMERFGRIDICVTNAGGPPSKKFAETKIEDWASAVNLNR